MFYSISYLHENSKVKTNKKAVLDGDREKIVTKCFEGCSVKTISVVLSLNYHTVHSIVSKFLKYGNADRKKTGGNRKQIFTPELKEALLRRVDADCTTTLKQLKEWLKIEHSVEVSITTINRTLKNFHYSLKNVTTVPEKRNCTTTLGKRHQYAQDFRLLETSVEEKNIVFLDEVGFSVVS